MGIKQKVIFVTVAMGVATAIAVHAQKPASAKGVRRSTKAPVVATVPLGAPVASVGARSAPAVAAAPATAARASKPLAKSPAAAATVVERDGPKRGLMESASPNGSSG